MSVAPSQFELIGKLLDAAALRHKVTSQNVANVNTPGYRSSEVSFEEQLQQQLSVDAEVPIEVSDTPHLKQRADGNNVDIDLEMGRLDKNALLYNTYSQVLASKLAMMQSAIRGQ